MNLLGRTPYEHGYEDAFDRGWNASGVFSAYPEEYQRGYKKGRFDLLIQRELERDSAGSSADKTIKELQAALAAEREAVRVAAETEIKNAKIDWEERGSFPMTWENFVDQAFRTNPILDAACEKIRKECGK